MKIYGTVILAALAMASVCVAAPSSKKASAKKVDMSSLGDVMFIGDSITHGVDSGSYRWALHKILVDNGIGFDAVGIETGNKSGGVKPGALYIGKTFNNKHCAMVSQRAYETSGRDHTTSSRLDKTDILDWLKLDEKYTGPKKIDGDAPDTYFILLGTNDLLSDHADDGIGKHLPEVEKALLDKKKGDMSVIVDSIRKANKMARVVVLTIPTWGNTDNNNTAKDYAVVMGTYNKKLMQWAKGKKVILADVNKGMIDVANTGEPGKGVPGFFHPKDGLHPNAHGDMLIAGHVAHALGIAGRSAGLPRKSSEEFGVTASALMEAATEKEGVEAGEKALTVAPGKKLAAPWPAGSDLTKGFTVALTSAVGDGAKEGWETDKGLEVQVGSGAAVSGTLTITESYLKWGDKIVYSTDMSQNKEPIRVAWTPGNPDYGVDQGFYVWLGDMLVGEALPSDKAGVNGVSISNTGGKAVVLKHVAAEPSAVAPSTKGYVKEEVTIAPKVSAPAPAGK